MKYQLVTPFHSHKLHEATNLKSGSSKCYKELKHSKHIIGCKEFSVMDVDNYKIYNFSINGLNQSGGFDQIQQPPVEDASILLPAPNSTGDIAILPSKIDQTQTTLATSVTLETILAKLIDIEKRIETIEKRSIRPVDVALDTKVYDSNLNRLQTIKLLEDKDKDDECVIM